MGNVSHVSLVPRQAIRTASVHTNPSDLRRYTFNTPANEVNSTYVNLKERQGFIIAPFTLPTATAAATYTIERDGYVIEPQYNFHT